MIKALADTGAETSIVSIEAIKLNKFKIIDKRDVDTSVIVANKQRVHISEQYLVRLVDRRGMEVDVWSYAMACGYDLILGMNFLCSARQTIFDWRRKSLTIVRTENSLTFDLVSTKSDSAKGVYTTRDLELAKGINIISREATNISGKLSNAMVMPIDGLEDEGLVVPRQLFGISSLTADDLVVCAREDITIAKGALIGNLITHQTEGIRVGEMFNNMVKEARNEAQVEVKTTAEKQVNQVSMDGSDEDPPEIILQEGEVEEAWRTDLGRSPGNDPNFKVVTEEEFQEV